MQSGNYGQNSTRALSKQAYNSGDNSSFRVYYGGAAGATPFRWESQPGTPKHTFSETSLPPLTPPPSYYNSSSYSNSKSSSKQTLLSSIFPRFTPRKSRTFSSSSVSSFSSSSLMSWSSSHSSSCSSPSRPKLLKRRRCRSLDSPSLPFEYNVDDNHESGGQSNYPPSTMCFGGSSIRGSCFRGCYRLVNVKKALMSIVGHGSTKRGNVN